MRRPRSKAWIALLTTVMISSLSYGVEIRYQKSGDWFKIAVGSNADNGWRFNVGTIPGPADDARMNWNGGTVTLTNGVALVGSVQVGWDEVGHFVIGAGGDFSTTESVFTNFSSVGFNRAGSLTVQTGGTALFRSDLRIGQQGTGVGTVNIDGGTITVEGEIRLGEFGTGTVFVNQGGLLNLSGLTTNGVLSITPGSALDVRGTGQVIISGNATDAAALYVANGTLLGNGVTNNVDVQVSIVGLETNTIITGLVVIPNVIGNTLTAASNSIVSLNYTLGTVGVDYEQGVLSDIVLTQDPAGGITAPPATAVNLVIQEPLLPASRVDNLWMGTEDNDWMNPLNWSLGIAPVKETQNYRARTFSSNPILLTNSMQIVQLVVGQGGDSDPHILKITGGAQVYAGRSSSGGSLFTGIGHNRPAILTIETNSLLRTDNTTAIGQEGAGPHNVEVYLDGGSFIGPNWLSLGNANNQIFATITIDNGGFLSFQRIFENVLGPQNSTNGVINLLDGVIELNGNKSNYFETVIASGFIVIAPGLPYSIDVGVTTPNKTTLRVARPGYAAWAQTWGVDIGSETDDYDNDMADNLWEYAANGNPTNALDTGTAPMLENAAGVIRYIHLQRADDPFILYTVQTRDALTSGSWANSGTMVLGTEVTGGDYNVVTNLVNPVEDQSFLRVEVSIP